MAYFCAFLGNSPFIFGAKNMKKINHNNMYVKVNNNIN